jgi:hypothetical protein
MCQIGNPKRLGMLSRHCINDSSSESKITRSRLPWEMRAIVQVQRDLLP